MRSGFRDFTIRGRRHTLSHLRPMTVSGCTDGSQDDRIRVLVTFSSHCWSDKFDMGVHTPDLTFKDELGRKRGFDHTRYEASLKLPQLMEDIWSRRICWTDRKNYVWTVFENGLEDYSVFFTMMASGKRRANVHCLVQSAYFRANLPRGVVDSFRFCDAVDHVLNLSEPPDRRESAGRQEQPGRERVRMKRHAGRVHDSHLATAR